LVIVKGSPNAEQAMDYIAFIDAHPEQQAEYTNRTYYSSTSLPSVEYIREDVKADLPLVAEHLEYGVPVDDDFWAENLDSLTEQFNIWMTQ
jgi:putative spermidine/putrescine transport system substrate-binding protein